MPIANSRSTSADFIFDPLHLIGLGSDNSVNFMQDLALISMTTLELCSRKTNYKRGGWYAVVLFALLIDESKPIMLLKRQSRSVSVAAKMPRERDETLLQSGQRRLEAASLLPQNIY